MHAVALANGWYNLAMSDWGSDHELRWGGQNDSLGCHVELLPDWLTDERSAFELVSEMNSDHEYNGVNLCFDRHANLWEAALDKHSVCDGEFEVGDTVCVAICRLYVAYKSAKRPG